MKWKLAKYCYPLKEYPKNIFSNRSFSSSNTRVDEDTWNDPRNEKICIVGAGPSGMLLSILLSRYGVHHTLIDRKLTPTTHPQAHFINARSMEILRDFLSPSIFHEIVSASPHSNNWRDFSYCYSLTGNTFVRTDHFSPQMTSPLFWDESPTNVLHLPQSIFETFLHKEISQQQDQQRNQSSPSTFARTLYGYDVTHVDFNSNENTAIKVSLTSNTTSLSKIKANDIIKNLPQSSSIPSTTHFHPQYLIAADGANSMLRKLCHIDMMGQENMQELVKSILFARV